MSETGGEEPSYRASQKTPKRHWLAEESFCDLKASHWVEIILTVVLIYVGVLQFCVYTRQAHIMGIQTKIYTDQLQATYEVQRAFITVSGVNFIPFRDASGKITEWWYVPVIKNSGTTPTKDLLYVTSNGGAGENLATALNETATTDWNPENAFKIGYKSNYDIGPLGTLDGGTPAAGVPIATLSKINSGGVFQVITGDIHYNDVFFQTPNHRTMYCFLILVNRNQTGDIVLSAIRCPRWNCTDDECAN